MHWLPSKCCLVNIFPINNNFLLSIEYADDLSKSEFLREIGLMKTLGYHERLVNMLACVTQSEPYCLVVEYCSDGWAKKSIKREDNVGHLLKGFAAIFAPSMQIYAGIGRCRGALFRPGMRY